MALEIGDASNALSMFVSCAFDSGTQSVSLPFEGYTEHPSDAGGIEEAHQLGFEDYRRTT